MSISTNVSEVYMKTTGMVRRIDELGRIVIPKEIRKQLMMKEGESISFSLDGENIVLTKFSLLNKLSPVIDSLLDGLYTKYQNVFLVSDLTHVLMCSGAGLSLYQRKPLPKDMILSITHGKHYKEETILFLGEERIAALGPSKIPECFLKCMVIVMCMGINDHRIPPS